MQYESYGDIGSPALVFLHGFLGDGSQFEFLVNTFSQDFHLIFIDLPGCGAGVEDLSDDFSFESICSDLSVFLQDLDLKQPKLIGYSLGARLGLYVHLTLSYQFDALFLESLNPGLLDTTQKVKRAEKDQKLSDKILYNGYDEFLVGWYSSKLFSDLSKEELFASALKFNSNNQALILKNLSPGLMPNMWQELGSIDVPVCLLTGDLDSKFTEYSKKVLNLIPNSRHEIVLGAGHNLHLSNPIEYTKILREFLTHISFT